MKILNAAVVINNVGGGSSPFSERTMSDVKKRGGRIDVYLTLSSDCVGLTLGQIRGYESADESALNISALVITEVFAMTDGYYECLGYLQLLRKKLEESGEKLRPLTVYVAMADRSMRTHTV